MRVLKAHTVSQYTQSKKLILGVILQPLTPPKDSELL